MTIQGLMQIGELAKKSEASVRSLRYYEELGLLKPVSHSAGGFRLYTDEDLKKIYVIKYLKRLGLSLHEIVDIFHSGKASLTKEDALNPVIALLKGRLAMTTQKIQELRVIQKEIANTIEILDVCRSRDSGGPLLEEQRMVCEQCDNLKTRSEIPKMLSIFF